MAGVTQKELEGFSASSAETPMPFRELCASESRKVATPLLETIQKPCVRVQACDSETTLLDTNSGRDLVTAGWGPGPGPVRASHGPSWQRCGMSALLALHRGTERLRNWSKGPQLARGTGVSNLGRVAQRL